MPVHIIPENCEGCGEETTVYIRGKSCGYSDIISVSSVCARCDAERTASEKPEPPELRNDKALEIRGDEPSNLVCAEEDDRHHVYELIDARDNSVFYVGVTANPKSRYSNHRADPSSAAYSRFREAIDAGSDCSMVVVATFYDRQRAKAFEALLINQTSNLVNRAIPPLRAV